MDMRDRIGKICFLACLLFSAVLALGAATGCSITVTNPNSGATYSAYQMMTVTDGGSDSAYFYAPTADWEAFFSTGAGASYVSSSGGYYTWIEGMDSAANVETFAASAKTYAASLSPAATVTADSADSAVTLSGLEAGYYLVTSTSGSKAMVLTTGSSATITEKNLLPTVTLQAQDGTEWVSKLSVNVRDTFPCRVVITVQNAAGPYTLNLTLTQGLIYYGNAKIYRNSVTDDALLTKGTDYTETKTSLTASVIAFSADYISGLTAGDQIIIDFTGKLQTASMDVSEFTIAGTLSYTGGESTSTVVTVQSFSFDIVKTDESGNLLDGAQFYLYDAETGGNIVATYKDKQTGGYRMPYPALTNESGTTITATDGKATVYGLKSGVYYLEETVSPTGYNGLSSRQAVNLTSSSLAATMNADGTYASGGVQVINRGGTVLPATGGMGTAMFYLAGSLLMLAAVVYFVAKRRAAEESLDEGSR